MGLRFGHVGLLVVTVRSLRNRSEILYDANFWRHANTLARTDFIHIWSVHEPHDDCLEYLQVSEARLFQRDGSI